MLWTFCLVFMLVAAPGGVFARDHVEVAGSSTVFPFTAAVINHVKHLSDVSVVSNSTGTGGGMQAFCSGLSDKWPDVAGASRRMTEAERNRCQQNNVRNITELAIGFDGIVIANSSRSPKVNFTRQHLYRALAKEVVQDGRLIANPYRKWNEIEPYLPGLNIEMVGPPSTSGTRDTFEELALKPPCKALTTGLELTAQQREAVCTTLRRDGHYTELGEDDVEFIKRLKVTPDAFGIFGYSYVLRFRDVVQPNSVDGVLPNPETISSGSYPLSRPLFLYVKDDRMRFVPGLAKFLSEYLSDQALGPEGYLADVGLVPLSDEQRAAVQSVLVNLLKK